MLLHTNTKGSGNEWTWLTACIVDHYLDRECCCYYSCCWLLVVVFFIGVVIDVVLMMMLDNVDKQNVDKLNYH